MTKRDAFQDAFSVLIILIGLFVCFNGFLCDYVGGFNSFSDALFGGVILSSCLITVLSHMCRLLRISFSLRKRERTIAAIYIGLFILSIYYILFFVVFGLFNYSVYDPKWLIVRNDTSLLFLVFCTIWLAIRCISFLRKGSSPIAKEETSKPASDTTSLL
jgi:hypothetical protein